MLLCNRDIRNLCKHPLELGMVNDDEEGSWARTQGMLYPFSEGVQGDSVISYGLSHAGYDLRLGNRILVFKNSYNMIIDPKRFKDPTYRAKVFDEVMAEDNPDAHIPVGSFIIPAHSYALGFSLEHIRIPRHLKGRCVGKSTLARCGILINTTPLEPGWFGHLTIEISNISPCPGLVYANEGIAQLEFEILSGEPDGDYADKGGKYQDQGPEPIPARIKE